MADFPERGEDSATIQMAYAPTVEVEWNLISVDTCQRSFIEPYGSGSSGLCTGQDAAGGEFLRYFPDVRAAPPGDISDSRPSVLDCSREAGTIVPDACRKNRLADESVYSRPCFEE